jgi:hypothetical protein
MKLYLVTIGSFRNMIIQSNLDPVEIRVHCRHKGWNLSAVSVIEPGTLEDIPYHPNHPEAKNASNKEKM